MAKHTAKKGKKKNIHLDVAKFIFKLDERQLGKVLALSSVITDGGICERIPKPVKQSTQWIIKRKPKHKKKPKK